MMYKMAEASNIDKMRRVCFVIALSIVQCVAEHKVLTTQDFLINFVRDSLTDITRSFNKTDDIRVNSRMSASFEVGFVIRSMEECYRRMVDIYNSTLTTDLNGWDAKTTDNIVFLKNVEMLYWVLLHLARMLHEVEKKYKLKDAGMFEKQKVWTIGTRRTTKRGKSTPAPLSITPTTPRRTQTWFPIDYGWPMSYERR